MVFGVQAVNGCWNGLVYLLSGGDLLPCVISHALYDSHVFVATWMRTNSQMDYTEEAFIQKVEADDEAEIRQIRQEAGPSLKDETLAHARLFFHSFDYDRQGALSKSDVKRAITYAFLQDEKEPSEEQISDLYEQLLEHRREYKGQEKVEDRLHLPEFIRMLLLLKATPEAS
jgi:hypothetical protein